MCARNVHRALHHRAPATPPERQQPNNGEQTFNWWTFNFWKIFSYSLLPSRYFGCCFWVEFTIGRVPWVFRALNVHSLCSLLLFSFTCHLAFRISLWAPVRAWFCLYFIAAEKLLSFLRLVVWCSSIKCQLLPSSSICSASSFTIRRHRNLTLRSRSYVCAGYFHFVSATNSLPTRYAFSGTA